jgi:hypothetical protein
MATGILNLKYHTTERGRFSRFLKNVIQTRHFDGQFRHLLWIILRRSQYISIYIMPLLGWLINGE